MHFEDENPEAMEELDAFIEYLKELPRANTFMVNPETVSKMRRACSALSDAIKLSSPQSKIKCERSELVEVLGKITVEDACIEICNTDGFGEAAGLASNTEIYPLTDGRVRMTLGFNNLTIPVK